jgi:hypothetical protein
MSTIEKLARKARKSHKVPENPPRKVLTINQYCAQEDVSRGRLYDEWRKGIGPRYFKRGSRRFISVEAADEHRRRLEAEALAGRTA